MIWRDWSGNLLSKEWTRLDGVVADPVRAGSVGVWDGPVSGQVTAVFRLLDGVRSLLRKDQQEALGLLTDIIRVLDNSRGSTITHRGGLASWQVQRLTQQIEDKLESALPQRDLAARVGLSTHHFARAFKHSFGQTPHMYVTERRIARAKDFMLSSNKSLCEIAVACGLSDQAHLSRLFRRVVGTTPLVWRRANKLIFSQAALPNDIRQHLEQPPCSYLPPAHTNV